MEVSLYNLILIYENSKFISRRLEQKLNIIIFSILLQCSINIFNFRTNPVTWTSEQVPFPLVTCNTSKTKPTFNVSKLINTFEIKIYKL